MDTASNIRNYIQDQLLVGNGSLRDDTPLWGGVIDSAGLMQLIVFIEDQFGIEVEDEELTSTHFSTVADIATLVDRKVASA